jgi:hypothetical protein
LATVNQPLPPDRFAMLRGRVAGFLAGQNLFVQDLYAGADPAHRIRVWLVTNNAWHALFARNMFIRPAAEDLSGFVPDWTILHAPGFRADPRRNGALDRSALARLPEDDPLLAADCHRTRSLFEARASPLPRSKPTLQPGTNSAPSTCPPPRSRPASLLTCRPGRSAGHSTSAPALGGCWNCSAPSPRPPPGLICRARCSPSPALG